MFEEYITVVADGSEMKIPVMVREMRRTRRELGMVKSKESRHGRKRCRIGVRRQSVFGQSKERLPAPSTWIFVKLYLGEGALYSTEHDMADGQRESRNVISHGYAAGRRCRQSGDSHAV